MENLNLIEIIVLIVGAIYVYIVMHSLFLDLKDSCMIDDHFPYVGKCSDQLISINDLYYIDFPALFWIEGDTLDNISILDLDMIELSMNGFSNKSILAIFRDISEEDIDKICLFANAIDIDPYTPYGIYSGNTKLSDIIRYIHDNQEKISENNGVINHTPFSNNELKEYFTFVKAGNSIITKNRKIIVNIGEYGDDKEYDKIANQLEEVEPIDYISKEENPKSIDLSAYKVIKLCVEKLI